MIVSDSILADILSISKTNVRQRLKSGKLTASECKKGKYFFDLTKLDHEPVIHEILNSNYQEEMKVKPKRDLTCIELFAGAGGLAIGLESAGFEKLLLNEVDKSACETLSHNRPEWNVVHSDIKDINFKKYAGKLDLLSGGFPCQAFSYAGKSRGFEDARGTLFYEYARAIQEIRPKAILAENVRGLLTHDSGKTIRVIKDIINELGYTLVAYEVLKAIFYRVPQKRERLIIVGVRNDLLSSDKIFKLPSKSDSIYTLSDALKKGSLYNKNVPKSEGQKYPSRKAEILSNVPQGGYWKDLPLELQKEFMKGSFYLGGGKTGMARRLSMDEPSLTLTTAPAQKQTERCHPLENRPLTVREYARIQTFPDSWEFCGSLTNQYKQIGNAVPCNLAHRVGNSLVAMFNKL